MTQAETIQLCWSAEIDCIGYFNEKEVLHRSVNEKKSFCFYEDHFSVTFKSAGVSVKQAAVLLKKAF